MCPRTSDQLQQLRETKKQQIMQAALKVFASRGFNGATINMIAKEAGIAKGLMYSYYESKEKLLGELLNFGMQKAASFLYEDASQKLETKKQFADSLRKMVKLFLQEADFWRLYTVLALQPHIAEKFQQEATKFIQEYLEVYMAYFKKKKSSNPMAEAMLFGAVLDGLMFDLMVAPEEYPIEDVVEMIIKKFA